MPVNASFKFHLVNEKLTLIIIKKTLFFNALSGCMLRPISFFCSQSVVQKFSFVIQVPQRSAWEALKGFNAVK